MTAGAVLAVSGAFVFGLFCSGAIAILSSHGRKEDHLDSVAFGYWVGLLGPARWRTAAAQWADPKMEPMRANMRRKVERAVVELSRYA